jgi:hypothetical protein
MLHIYANMQCMKLIAFESFNNARMNLIVTEFIDWWEKNMTLDDKIQGTTTLATKQQPVQLNTPKEIAKVEPLFFIGFRQRKIAPFPIHFGVSFDEFYSSTKRTPPEIESTLHQSSQDKYMIATGTTHRRLFVVVSFLLHASPEDQAKAYFHAILLSRQLKKQGAHIDGDASMIASAEGSAREALGNSWDMFCTACRESGWDLSKTELRSHGYELEIS